MTAYPKLPHATHNGAQDAVLAAIKRHAGVTAAGLERETGFTPEAIQNAIRRLSDAGEIRRMTLGGYAAINKRCLLSDFW